MRSALFVSAAFAGAAITAVLLSAQTPIKTPIKQAVDRPASADPRAFFDTYCITCHDSKTPQSRDSRSTRWT